MTTGLGDFIPLAQMLDFQDLYDTLYSNHCVLNMTLSLFKFVILRLPVCDSSTRICCPCNDDLMSFRSSGLEGSPQRTTIPYSYQSKPH